MVCPGDTVGFDASASRDLDGTISAYHWDFGDGATAEGETVDHVFAKPGTYQVALTVTDDAGSSCSATTDTMTVMVDATPVADAGDRPRGLDRRRQRRDPPRRLGVERPRRPGAEPHWQIGDADSEIGERVRHTLTTAGKIPVTLTVADTSGLACGTASTTVQHHCP